MRVHAPVAGECALANPVARIDQEIKRSTNADEGAWFEGKFKFHPAGVDLAGVHLYGSNLDPENLAYKSSAISEIANWKSPVFLIHGDDDRNVNFAQTVGLVQLLRARNIYHELIVIPDIAHFEVIRPAGATWEAVRKALAEK